MRIEHSVLSLPLVRSLVRRLLVREETFTGVRRRGAIDRRIFRLSSIARNEDKEGEVCFRVNLEEINGGWEKRREIDLKNEIK